MRTVNRLTFTTIKHAKPGSGGKTVLLCDGGGLWLQVSRGKDGQVCKSWIFRYATPRTKVARTGREYRAERQMGLGALKNIGAADRPAVNADGSPMLDPSGKQVKLPGARTLAAQARSMLAAGIDPIDARDASRAAATAARGKRVTFDRAAENYLRRHEDGWRNPSHRRQWRSSLRKFISRVLGKLDVEAIDTEDVLKVLDPIWMRIPETASRVRGRIETVLDFSARNGTNPARWQSHLEHRLARRDKALTVKKLAALPYDQIAAFMTELRAVNSIAARALEFLILTAARTGEVTGARWVEIDFNKRLWTIPVERLKRPGEQEDGSHVIPLSDAAPEVLHFMAGIRQDARVFAIGEHAMRLVMKDLRPFTVHGFRSTFS